MRNRIGAQPALLIGSSVSTHDMEKDTSMLTPPFQNLISLIAQKSSLDQTINDMDISICGLDFRHNFCLNLFELVKYHGTDCAMSSTPSMTHHSPGLKWLDLCDARISDPPPAIKSVLHLQLGHNLIEQIDRELLASWTSLQILNLSHNRLSDLFIPNNLIEIDLSHNFLGPDIATRHFSSTNLKRLNLSHNRIAGVSEDLFDALPALELFDISFNRLRELPITSLSRSSLIQELNLEGNHLSCASLAAIFRTTYTSVAHLRLGSQANPVSYLPTSILNIQCASRITLISLSHCSLTFFPIPLTHLATLEEIDLSHNLLTNLEALKYASPPSLHKLNLHGNLLTVGALTPLEKLGSLKTLILSQNSPLEFPLTFLSSNLREIVVSHNSEDALGPGWSVYEAKRHCCQFCEPLRSNSTPKHDSFIYHKVWMFLSFRDLMEFLMRLLLVFIF